MAHEFSQKERIAAFPTVCHDISKTQIFEEGMSMWEYFAAAALAGAVGNAHRVGGSPQQYAEFAAEVADAMMRELERRR